MSIMLKQSLPIPSEYAGAIIGAGGQTIDRILQDLKGVHINTRNQNNKDDATWTYFYITGGTPQDHDRVKRRIMRILVSVCAKEAASVE